MFTKNDVSGGRCRSWSSEIGRSPATQYFGTSFEPGASRSTGRADALKIGLCTPAIDPLLVRSCLSIPSLSPVFSSAGYWCGKRLRGHRIPRTLTDVGAWARIQSQHGRVSAE